MLGLAGAAALATPARAAQVAVTAVLVQTPITNSMPVLPASGDIVVYRLVVTHTGDENIDTMTVTDTVGPQLAGVTMDQPAAFTPAITQGVSGTIYAWSGAALGMLPGEAYTFTLTGRVGDSCVPALVTNTPYVVATGPTSATEWSANPAGFPLAFNVQLQHALDIPEPNAGQVVTYTLNVVNTGTSTIDNLTLTDTLSSQVTPAGASVPAGFALLVASVPGSGTRFVWTGTNLELPPGGAITFTLTGTVAELCFSFSVTNTARVEASNACTATQVVATPIAWTRSLGTLTPPANFVARPGDTWSVLSWEGAANERNLPMTAWTVSRSIVSGSGFVWVGSVGVDAGGADFDTRGFWDTGLANGTTYYYKIGAVTGCATLYSSEVSVTPQDATVLPALGAFGTVYSEAGDGYVRLKWTYNPYPSASGLASPGEQNVSAVRVWFSATTTGPWLYAGQGPNTGSFLTFGDDVNTPTPAVESLQNGGTYWFMVVPGLPDRRPSFLRGTPYRPARSDAQPAIATNPACPRGVRIAWEPAQWGTYTSTATGQGIGYAIFRSDDGGSTLVRLKTPGGADIIPYNELSYVDCTVPTYGKRYLYLIRPVDTQGNLGLAYPSALIDVVLPAIRTYPDRNRFRPGRGEAVNIVYQTTEPGRVRVSVWTPGGELVRKLHDEEYAGNLTVDTPYNSRDRGAPALVWDGTNDSRELVGTGAYLIVIEVNGKRDFRSVAVLR